MKIGNRYNNVFQSTRQRRRRLLVFLLVLVLIFIALIAFNIRRPEIAAKEKSKPDQELYSKLPALHPGPFQAEADWANKVQMVKVKIRKNETVSSALTGQGLDRLQVFNLTQACAKVLDLKKVRPGTEFTLYLDENHKEVERCEISYNQGHRVVVLRTPGGHVAASQAFEPVVCLEFAEGEIELSLWGTAVERLKINPEVILSFSDIFAYDVDFFTDVQAKDTFSLLYEKKYLNGHFIGPGQILAAEFVNKGRKLEAYYFKNAKGEAGYYNAKGRSLRKMFLKSPLRYRRISSYFSRVRFHPILKIYRPHLGIDYAAPVGTPVETVGDGRVVFMGRKGGYGKFVKIKHNRAYTTTYAHLSRYAKGLKKGKWVRQGDLIGYVGSTGLSTGPHLDYRITKNNKFINPLSLKLEPAPPIASSERPRFFAQIKQVQAATSRLQAARR
ncbi:MAG: M23 family metallopeptidase [Deltaproteobacteria bacterium]|nr:M23 family metallopeptidase [Deltaproteobacteria bacterium]MBW2050775.1 M23 family metallopeptidase [Deltaproteobacteria bacterium]MBW2139524.1 M23 family metallopeptidase [Deltaproteobacteria bacterium]MBW2321926.1 M23 family metallopeptidase [Deltaproteobacteria bacterium]